MLHSSFLFPEIVQDTPRLFTAIAEFLAVFVYFNIYKRKPGIKRYVAYCIIFAAVMVIYQYVAGLLNIYFWIPAMMGAVALMYFAMFLVLDIKPLDCGALTVHSFVLAEFAASFYRQLYVWVTYITGKDMFICSLSFMIVVYAAVYLIYFRVERINFMPDRNLNITRPELFSVIATGVGAFIMSNISFVWSTTPFSTTNNMLYVRTLVDFGGMLMLMTQMGRRTEMAIKTENDAINQLFSKQYEQYKLAVDNSEGLRKEMHDMKHYVAALKQEDDPEKRAEILSDMEQTIAIQEAFMNTGNQVLDVILTTKSLQCQKKGITLNAMIDGDTLSEIHVKDLCSLFGNVLDNAIEATQLVEDREKRLINLSVRRKNKFIIMECENFSDYRLASGEELPSTSKGDKVHHGFGLKSISKVAEKYGGAMNITTHDGWFKVKVLLSSNN